MMFKTANAEEKVEGNPVAYAERPKAKRRRILQPAEIIAVTQELKDERACLIFRTAVLRDYDATSFATCSGVTSISWTAACAFGSRSRSTGGEPSPSPALREDLLSYRMNVTAFRGVDEYVFAHPRLGSKFEPN
jgi:hypothetical protein